MWKILVAFAVFAMFAMFVLIKGGGDIDLGGEKHGIETAPAAHVPASAPAK